MQAIRDKGNFIYLRRTIEQIKSVTDFYGEVINQPEFDGWMFKEQGDKLYAAKAKEDSKSIEWKEIGRMYGLSAVNKIRSNELPSYRYLLFDEFLPDSRGQFMRNEVQILMDIMFSIFRERDFQAFLLSNAVMLHNPYFTHKNMEIIPNVFEEFSYGEGKKHLDILLQILKPSDNWNNYIRSTAIGRLIEGTEYEDFALGNKFKDNDDTLVEPKTRASKNIAIFKVYGNEVGVWYDKNTKYVYFTDDFNPTLKMRFGFYAEDFDEQNASYKDLFNSKIIERIVYARQNNRLRYTSTKAKSHIQPGLEKMRII